MRHHAKFATASLACLSVACVCGCSQMQDPAAGPARQVKSYDAATFFDTTSMAGASFSADEGKILFASDASGVFNLYSQPIDGGAPTQLTDSTTESIFAVSWFPRDDRILYSADKGGNELNHLFVRSPDGEAQDLTPAADAKASFAGWSGDKQSFWVLTNERDPQAMDLYRYATDGYAREMVFENTETWDVSDVSEDGRWVALTRSRTNADSDIYLWDSSDAGQAPRLVTQHDGDVSHRVYTFTPDSNELYYGTNAHGEFNQAWAYDMESGKHRRQIKDRWDVSYVSFSEDGRFRVSAINQDARTKVTIIDTESGRKVQMPQLLAGDIRGVSIAPSEEKMAFYINGDTSPSNLYAMTIGQQDPRQLSDTLSPAINAHDLAAGHVVRYRSFDRRKIPAIIYRPWAASKDSKVPALVWVHGGPGGQSRHGYNPTIQHLVNHGYAVLAVNNRGSSGYGKTFFHLDDQKHGDVDLKDCIWGRRYLEELDWVDAEHIGIIGGSYGGYMVAAALAFEPEAFDVGVNIFGVTNWLRTLKSIPPWWADFRDALFAEMGDPSTDEDKLRAKSPLFHASNIVKPLLVVQGANDPRVLQAESDELVEAARQNGTPVEYVLFPDEGHGFRKKANRIAASDAYVTFLNTHLRGKAAPASAGGGS